MGYRKLSARPRHHAQAEGAIEAFKLPARLDEIARDQGIPADAIEVWFADEARIGQKNKITRRWARRGSRPAAPQDSSTGSTYIFGAICPEQGKGAGLSCPGAPRREVFATLTKSIKSALVHMSPIHGASTESRWSRHGGSVARDAVHRRRLGSAPGAQSYARGGCSKGYRNGTRERQLTGSFGAVVISVPRFRLTAEDGDIREWRSSVLPRYARMTRRVEALIAGAYLAGTNTRRVKCALGALFKGGWRGRRQPHLAQGEG